MSPASTWGMWIRSHVCLVFVLWSLWLAAPYLCAGSWSYVRIADCADDNLPRDMAVASELRKGTVNYWAPFQLCGSDAFTSSRFPFKIDVLLCAALPVWLAHGLLIWFGRWLAGYFTYLLLRRTFQIDHWPAMFSGLAYAALPYHFELSVLLVFSWTPFVIWFLSRQDPNRFKSFLLSALMGVLTAICCNIQITVFLVPVVVFWFLLVDRNKSCKFWAMAATLGFAFAVAESQVLLPLYLNGSWSHRTSFQPMTDGFSSPWAIAVRTCVMNTLALAWDNLPALLLVAASLVLSYAEPAGIVNRVETDTGDSPPVPDGHAKSRGPVLGSPALLEPELRRRLKWVLAAGAACALWPMLVLLGDWFKPLLPGFMRGFDFSRLVLFIPFLLIVSAGISLHTIGENRQLILESNNCRIFRVGMRNMLVAATLSLIVVQSFGMHSSRLIEAVKGSNYHTLYGNSNIRRLAERIGTEDLFRVATVVLHHNGGPQPGFSWPYGLESADGYSVFYSRRYKEFWAGVLAPTLSRDPQLAAFFLSWGSKAYLLSPFFFAGPDRRHFHEELVFGRSFNLDLLSLANVKYVISPVVLRDENLSPTFAPTLEEIAWQDNPGRFIKFIPYVMRSAPDFPLYVYKNLRVVPRFRLVGKVKLFDDPRDVLKAMELADQGDLISQAFLEREAVRDLPAADISGPGGSVRLESYAWDRIVITARCETPSVLIVANTWSPYWRASVGGVESRVFPANHAFQGMYCPAGNHEIILRYMPPYRLSLSEG